MNGLAGLAGAALVGVVLWDAFQVMILPRRAVGGLRLARAFYRLTWGVWSAVVRRTPAGPIREAYLSVYGPLSLPVLLICWASAMVVGFALVQWAIRPGPVPARALTSLSEALYFSGSTFFTLGLGDVVPASAVAKLLTVVEAATGFLFLAVVVGYLPVMYQAFSRREVSISMLDARAGSPPSAGELLHRHGDDLADLQRLLHDWERWSAELLESHLSYPVLAYFRSQHDNQSWLAALTTILDASALMAVAADDRCRRQAQLTFAMARHAVGDLAHILGARPRPPTVDRLPPAAFRALRRILAVAGIELKDEEDGERRLGELRALYEPFVNGLARRLLFEIPGWTGPDRRTDSWQTTAWEDHP